MDSRRRALTLLVGLLLAVLGLGAPGTARAASTAVAGPDAPRTLGSRHAGIDPARSESPTAASGDDDAAGEVMSPASVSCDRTSTAAGSGRPDAPRACRRSPASPRAPPR